MVHYGSEFSTLLTRMCIVLFIATAYNARACFHFVVNLVFKFSVLKIDINCNFVGLLHHPFWLQLILAPFGHFYSTF